MSTSESAERRAAHEAIHTQLITSAYAYGDLADRTPLDSASGVAMVEQYARNLRAAAMTYYGHLKGKVGENTKQILARGDTSPDEDKTIAAVFHLLDTAFAMGAGALVATVMADPDGLREHAFNAWAGLRKFPTQTVDGIKGVTARTIYIRFPGSPHPIASLLVPVSFAARRT